MPQGRQLAAIMFTDIVGYTAMMGKDEEHAFKILEQNRKLHQITIPEFHGTLLKELGDGVMASFNAASDAVLCAKKIQETYKDDAVVSLRIGIHLGEVVFEENDVFGDGVNIASRIEQLAPAGAIYISESVLRNVENKREIDAVFIGEKVLRNVKHPVKIYGVKMDGGVNLGDSGDSSSISATAPEKSIAILPFVNMSNDPDQEYFCDGLTEELLNSLAQLDKFKVASRTSSFMFKGRNLDIMEVGQKLHVNTVLEGSVRKSQNRIRITAQLINVQDGYHLWSERYDRELVDIFDIQDEIALAIMDALKLKLLGREKTNMLKRSTENPEAYQLYLKGRQNFHKLTPDGYLKAIEFYKAAIEIDPAYSKAYAGMASCYLNLWHFDLVPADESLPFMIEATNKSMEFDDQNAESHLALARLKFWYDYNAVEAAEEFEKVVQFNPNIPDALTHYGFVRCFLGDRKKGITLGKKASELDPFSPMTSFDLAAILWMCQDYGALEEQCNKMIELYPNFWGGYFYLGICFWSQGDYVQSIAAFEKSVSLQNSLLLLSMLGGVYGIKGDKDKAREILSRMDEITKGEPMASFCYALVHAGLDDMDSTFDYLEKAGSERTGLLIFLDVGFRMNHLIPAFDNNPRMEEFIKRAGIPQRQI